MRTLASEAEFSEFLKSIGNGVSSFEQDLDPDLFEIPQQLLSRSIIKYIYGSLPTILETTNITVRVI